MYDINLGKEFENKKVCIKIHSVKDIVDLKFYIHEWLFEDISVLNSKLYHGIYDKWIQKGYELSIGKINDQVEVLDDSRFKNYRMVECDEFIENLKRW